MAIQPLTDRAVGADSDVAPLRRVLLHRPGEELDAVTAANADAFLFDGPVHLRAAQREHDALAAALASGGADVQYIERSAGAARALSGAAPLPNLVFTRDLFAVIGDGIAHGTMRRRARRREHDVALALLGELGAPVWSIGAPLEGGDVLVAGQGVLVVGIGERTSMRAAALLAKRLLAEGVAREVVGALIPPGGPFHLDLAISMVDETAFLIDRPVVDAMRAVRWRPGEPARIAGDLVEALAGALGAPLTMIPTLPAAHGRAWDRGANVVAIAPRRVVAYEDNRDTNRRLERAGIEVLAVPGRQLGLGRGGPRCLTAPLARG